MQLSVWVRWKVEGLEVKELNLFFKGRHSRLGRPTVKRSAGGVGHSNTRGKALSTVE